MSDQDEYPDIFRGARELVIAALPDPVIKLHSEIERFAGVPVDFRPTSMLRRVGWTGAKGDAAYCDETRAYVVVEDTGGINAEAVAHELLHIHRYWVEMAPQVDAAKDIGGNVEFMSWLDNALEHMIIVPRERDLGFDPTAHWATNMATLFTQRYPEPPLPQLTKAYLLGWTVTAYCPDPSARKIALAGLRRLGIQRDARILLEKLQKARGSKGRMVRIALEAMKLSPRNAVLVTLDVRNKLRVEGRVP